MRRLVAKLAQDAGIEGTVPPYDLRHSATSLLAAAGHSADRLADLLGHRDTRMVWKHYRHSINDSVEVAADYWRNNRDRLTIAAAGCLSGVVGFGYRSF